MKELDPTHDAEKKRMSAIATAYILRQLFHQNPGGLDSADELPESKNG